MAARLGLGGVVAPNPGLAGEVAVEAGTAAAGLGDTDNGTGGAESPGDAAGGVLVGVPVVVETSAGWVASPS